MREELGAGERWGKLDWENGRVDGVHFDDGVDCMTSSLVPGVRGTESGET